MATGGIEAWSPGGALQTCRRRGMVWSAGGALQACRREGLEMRCGRSNVEVLRYGALEERFRRVDVEAFRYAALEPECRCERIGPLSPPLPTPSCLHLAVAGILIKQSSTVWRYERVTGVHDARSPLLNIIGEVRPVNSIRAFCL